MEEKKKREAYRMFKAEVDKQELQKRMQLKLWQEQRKKELLTEHQQRKKVESIMRNEMKHQKTIENKMKNDYLNMVQTQKVIEKQGNVDKSVKWMKEMYSMKNYTTKSATDEKLMYHKVKLDMMKTRVEQEISYKKLQNDQKLQANEEKKRMMDSLRQLRLKGSADLARQNIPASLIEVMNKSGSNIDINNMDKIQMCKLKKDFDQKMKASSVLSKLDEVEMRLNMRKYYKERNRIMKNESENMRKEEFNLNMKRAANINEYNRASSLEKIREKNEKAESFRKYKQEVAYNKKIVSENINQKKKDILDKFERMMKNGGGFDVNEIRQLFPGDDELAYKIMQFQNGNNRQGNVMLNNSF